MSTFHLLLCKAMYEKGLKKDFKHQFFLICLGLWRYLYLAKDWFQLWISTCHNATEKLLWKNHSFDETNFYRIIGKQFYRDYYFVTRSEFIFKKIAGNMLFSYTTALINKQHCLLYIDLAFPNLDIFVLRSWIFNQLFLIFEIVYS